ncbi:ATP-binding cassette domain-containing protein [Pseudoxanthomonas sp.]|uniref:ATP-binding cassette domain-containing protein n=1 Tax=Pseudoxanthomonas sp. TaxID=1871049 RepID=UPI00261676C6|nr:ATP-binding cassette domain-containing protein [Pseudoxanthomonas sp.]WDS37447.1 MAG: ATP-binding cassette domain-containing protein [Pseudoxanthomonas sp.]
MTPVSLALEGVAFFLPDGRPLFSDLDVRFDARPTGLVGRNGAGKSVLARILSGQLAPSAGRCLRAGTVFHLPQQIAPVPGTTVAHVAGVQPVFDALARIEAGSVDPADFDIVGERWDIHQTFAAALEAHGLGHLTPGQPATQLSGGEHTRLALLGGWLAEPDFLLLDEPTNHLDRTQRRALIERLQHWPKGLLVISHDRELLDTMQRTVALTAFGLQDYDGGYRLYAAQRAQEQQHAVDALERAKTERRRAEAEARVLRERLDHRQAQATHKGRDANQAPILLGGLRQRSQVSAGKRVHQQSGALETLQQGVRDAASRIEHRNPIALFAPLPAAAAQRRAVVAEQLVLPFGIAGGQALDLVVTGRQRIGLVGDNGGGKSTLLQVLAGKVAPVSGACAIPVPFAYLDQGLDAIPTHDSPLQHLLAANPQAREAQVRMQLAQLGLSGDTVTTPCDQLSGGERLKTALAHALYRDTPAELLLLDEPTNHLDLDALQALEQTLRNYPGALLVVSHDAAFLQALDLQLRLEVHPQGWRLMPW